MSAHLGELISGIKHAIVDAHRSVGAQHMEELAQFFEYHGDQSPPPAFPNGQWRPKVVHLSVPKETSLNGKVSMVDHPVKVPLITLVPLRSYVIERAEILTKVNLGLLEPDAAQALTQGAASTPDDNPWSPLGLPDVTVQMGPSAEQTAELKIIVHGLDVPAGLSRLVGAYDKLLNAQLPS
jgi:hypothetical protein